MIIKVVVPILGMWTVYSWAHLVEVAGWETVKATGATMMVGASVAESEIAYGSANGNAGVASVVVTYIQTSPYRYVRFRTSCDSNLSNGCWGAPVTDYTRATARGVFAQPKTNITYDGGTVSIAGLTPDRCTVIQTFTTGHTGNGSPWGWVTNTELGGTCAMRPALTQCEMKVPPVMQHKTMVAGGGQSVAEITAEISCNRMTNVRVTGPRSIKMSDGNREIASTITVGGESSTIVIPNPTTTFQIKSTIDTTGASAGAYAGSFVLVAEWD